MILPDKFKILHVSRPDSKAGGAAAFRTHSAFLEAGYESKILLRDSLFDEGKDIYKMGDPSKITFKKIKNKVISTIKGIVRPQKIDTDPNYYFYGVKESHLFFKTREVKRKLKFKPDVIIFYFIDGFLNYQNIFELYLATKAKIFIYPMDMGPVTGGCHYNWECRGFTKNCEDCPAILDETYKDVASKNLSVKKRYINKLDFSIFAASQWLSDNISQSSLFKNSPVHKLLLPIEPEIFRPYPMDEAKKKFGLDVGKKFIFFGARYLKEKRKGYLYLWKAFEILRELIKGTPLEGNIALFIAGKDEDNFISTLPFEHTLVGMMDNYKDLPHAYNTAHIFVCPSIQDAGPMMINEALMCGTPVVAFNMGVAQDLVISGVTGHKATLFDSADLANGIFNILSKNPEEYSAMRTQCRDMALTQCSTSTIVSNVKDILFKKL